MCAGYAGRIGGPLLTFKQKDNSPALSVVDYFTLRLLAATVSCPEPRLVAVWDAPSQPLIIYSDVSFENDTLRLGWVVMWVA